jgi:hypothetical protein
MYYKWTPFSKNIIFFSEKFAGLKKGYIFAALFALKKRKGKTKVL